MKRLYKIIIFFILIFLVGIYITVRNINTTFSSDATSEVIYVTPITSNHSIVVL